MSENSTSKRSRERKPLPSSAPKRFKTKVDKQSDTDNTDRTQTSPTRETYSQYRLPAGTDALPWGQSCATAGGRSDLTMTGNYSPEQLVPENEVQDSELPNIRKNATSGPSSRKTPRPGIEGTSSSKSNKEGGSVSRARKMPQKKRTTRLTIAESTWAELRRAADSNDNQVALSESARMNLYIAYQKTRGSYPNTILSCLQDPSMDSRREKTTTLITTDGQEIVVFKGYDYEIRTDKQVISKDFASGGYYSTASLTDNKYRRFSIGPPDVPVEEHS